MTSPLHDVEQLETDVLQRARVGLEPTSAELERSLATLLTRLDAPRTGAPEDRQHGVPEGGAQLPISARSALWKGVLLGGSVGVLVGFAGGVLWPGTHRVEPMRVAAQPALETAAVQPPASVETASKPSAEVVAREVASGRPAKRSLAEASERKIPPTDAKVTFYEELSHVRRAQTALKEGNAALALGLMVSLRENAPGGGLLAERGVTEVLALCKLGRASEAETLARKLLEQPTGSVYEARLRSSCAFHASPSLPKE